LQHGFLQRSECHPSLQSRILPATSIIPKLVDHTAQHKRIERERHTISSRASKGNAIMQCLDDGISVATTESRGARCTCNRSRRAPRSRVLRASRSAWSGLPAAPTCHSTYRPQVNMGFLRLAMQRRAVAVQPHRKYVSALPASTLAENAESFTAV
jgi:hypothetical protein